MEESKIDVLLKLRRELEGELNELRNVLAIKTKAIQSLSDTIDMLRGWVPKEELPATKRLTYDDASLTSAIEDFFLNSSTGMVRMADLGPHLEEKGLIPSYCDATRTKINNLLNLMQGVKRTGHGNGAYYKLVLVTTEEDHSR